MIDKEAIQTWVKTLREPGSSVGTYRHSAGSDATAFSSCFAAFVLTLIGAIDDISKSERKQWAENLMSLQREDTGLFDIADIPMSQNGHDSRYVSWQLTTFCLSTLAELEHQPRFPLRFLDKWRDREILYAWLNGLEWTNPWLVGNLVMFLCVMLLWDAEHDNLESMEAVGHILDWHDEHQRPGSGFWGKGPLADFLEGLGGAFHQFLIYFYVERPLPRTEKIVDAVLRLQQRDGFFTPRMGGDGCADYDAVDTLCKISRISDYRHNDIRSALRRTYDALTTVWHPAGGFKWSNPDAFRLTDWVRHGLNLRSFPNWYYNNRQLLGARLHRRRPRYSQGWTRVGIPCEEPDLFATFLRVLTVYLIADVIDVPESAMQRPYLKTPGLGWHTQEVRV